MIRHIRHIRHCRRIGPVQRIRLHGDRGQVAGIEAVPFGVLIFVVGSLFITNLWMVIDTKLAVGAAAREAVRAYVEAPDAAVGRQEAGIAGRGVVEGWGRRAERLGMRIDHEGGRPFGRCVRVTATTSYRVPALRLPWIGGLGGGYDVRASHAERIDPFRDGLSGVGAC